MSSLTRYHCFAIAITALCSCGGGDAPTDPADGDLGPVTVDPDAPPAEKLSSYNLFRWSAASGFSYNERVVPYDLNTPLFSDYALKQRAIYVPEGAQATFDPEQAFGFPVGSVLIKNFYFAPDLRAPDRDPKLIETRLMIRAATGWLALPYLWNETQTDAVFAPAGDAQTISFIDTAGAPQTASYLVPTRNQCQTCHARQPTPQSQPEIVLVGIKARHLNRTYDYGGSVGTVNQLAHLGELGMLANASAAVAVAPAFDFRAIEASGVAALAPTDIEPATRSYLDINCGHCHNPQGVQGVTSQLYLNHDNADTFRLGICKRPGSAGSGNGGFTFDIVPGSPDTSILYFRSSTTLRGAMMPLLGRSLTHTRGSELLRAWIAAMPADDCE